MKLILEYICNNNWLRLQRRFDTLLPLFHTLTAVFLDLHSKLPYFCLRECNNGETVDHIHLERSGAYRTRPHRLYLFGWQLLDACASRWWNANALVPVRTDLKINCLAAWCGWKYLYPHRQEPDYKPFLHLLHQCAETKTDTFQRGYIQPFRSSIERGT